MGDLEKFLRARLDDDERYCRIVQAVGERYRDDATPAQITRDMPMMRELMDTMLDDRDVVCALTAVQKSGDVPNDLGRLLRDIEAKRHIIIACEVAQEPDAFGRPNIRRGMARRILQPMAAVYRDHPDFDPSWVQSPRA